jgi:hypothetical protein
MRGAGWALLEALVLKPWLRDVRLACEVVAACERKRKKALEFLVMVDFWLSKKLQHCTSFC